MTDILDAVKSALAARKEHGVFPSRQTWGETDGWLRALVAEVERGEQAIVLLMRERDEARAELNSAIPALIGQCNEEADRARRAEAEVAQWVATTIKGDMEMRADDPIGMMQEVCAYVDTVIRERDAARAEAARLREGIHALLLDAVDGDIRTLPEDSDGRFVPSEILRMLAALEADPAREAKGRTV